MDGSNAEREAKELKRQPSGSVHAADQTTARTRAFEKGLSVHEPQRVEARINVAASRSMRRAIAHVIDRPLNHMTRPVVANVLQGAVQ